jgi:hypothetical protein
VTDSEAERQRVLRAYFAGDRLVSMPRPGRKRRIVLEHLAGWFEPGERYAEAEVNERLRVAHADVAALRRYLVEEELLDRDHGYYWRCGGPVDVEAPAGGALRQATPPRS